MMHEPEKSDLSILALKRTNEAEGAALESVEQRERAKGNTGQDRMRRTLSRGSVFPGLERVRERARQQKKERFTALLHHVDIEMLRSAFFALQRDAAAGIDGLTWREYEQDLDGRLTDMHGRLHRGTYRALPSRRKFIPKTGGQRPLGVAALEDKILQRAVVEVFNAVYEVDFLGFSYGFRPGRSQHDALDAVAFGITRLKVNYILDCDIRGFFDSLSHEWLMRFIDHRIGDPRIVRLIRKWLKAGVVVDGRREVSDIGSPQGAVLSPTLANIYLHYCFDLWAEWWRRRNAHGQVVCTRYADDIVVGFECEDDAQRFLSAMRARLEEFALTLHPEKTRLIEFGRFAAERRAARGTTRPETFNFLGYVAPELMWWKWFGRPPKCRGPVFGTTLVSCLMPSQRLQELNDAFVLTPLPWGRTARNIAVCECLGLHFQIDLCIDMSCVQRHVSKPAADSVDVDTCAEQVAGSRMSNRMRTDAFGFERRHRRAGLSHRSPYQSVDAKPCQRLPEAVQEHSFVRTTVADETLEQASSFWPQRTMSDLVSLSYKMNGTRASPREITDCDLSSFFCTGTGVVEELKYCVVARALLSASIRSGQNRIHLRFIQIGHRRLAGLPKRHCPDLGTPSHMLWTVGTDELRQRVNGAETQIARAAAAAAILLKMFEKSANQTRRQVTDSQPIDRSFEGTAHEGQQQNHRVPITALSIASQIAFRDQVFKKKATDPRSHQCCVTHGSSPVARSVRSAGSLHAEAQAS